MNQARIKKLPAWKDILAQYPLSAAATQKVQRDRQEIRHILAGHDRRLLMIIGPCSAWPREAVLEYAHRLHALESTFRPVFKMVMRVYTQKPRTVAGWSGPLHMPNPFGVADMEAGIHYVRGMMTSLVEMGLPIAEECLFMESADVFSGLAAWLAIGARSSEDPAHRIFASGADCPVGLKNPTHGSLAVSVNSVRAAQHAHTTLFQGYQVLTQGNPHAHLVLRGANGVPNYSARHLAEVQEHMQSHAIQHPAILIDASHDNCIRQGKKEPGVQREVMLDTIRLMRTGFPAARYVKGFMAESFLKPGNQLPDPVRPALLDREGLSITDPCLGWEETKTLLFELAEEAQR